MIEGVFAAITSGVAVACVYWSWRQQNLPIVALAGWLLALVSMIAWSLVLGPEFGVTYAIMVFMCLVWAVVFKRMKAGSADNKTVLRPYQALARPDVSNLLKQGAMFLLSVPVAGVLAMMLSVAVVLYLPWTLLTKVTVAILLYPMIWGAISAWICAQEKTRRPALIAAGLFLISGLILFI